MVLFSFMPGNCNHCEMKVQGIHVMASSWPATAYMLQRKDAPAVLSDPTVVEVARKQGKHPSQILIRWAVQHGHSVSPKASTDVHLQVILMPYSSNTPSMKQSSQICLMRSQFIYTLFNHDCAGDGCKLVTSFICDTSIIVRHYKLICLLWLHLS